MDVFRQRRIAVSRKPSRAIRPAVRHAELPHGNMESDAGQKPGALQRRQPFANYLRSGLAQKRLLTSARLLQPPSVKKTKEETPLISKHTEKAHRILQMEAI